MTDFKLAAILLAIAGGMLIGEAIQGSETKVYVMVIVGLTLNNIGQKLFNTDYE